MEDFCHWHTEWTSDVIKNRDRTSLIHLVKTSWHFYHPCPTDLLLYILNHYASKAPLAGQFGDVLQALHIFTTFAFFFFHVFFYWPANACQLLQEAMRLQSWMKRPAWLCFSFVTECCSADVTAWEAAAKIGATEAGTKKQITMMPVTAAALLVCV